MDRPESQAQSRRAEHQKASGIIPPGTFSPLHEGVAASDLPDSAKVLHAVLCGYARGTGIAWPSVATLCDKTNQGINTVRRGIKRLCAAGLLVEIGRHRSGAIRYSVTNPEDVLPIAGPTRQTLAGRGGANLDPPSQFGTPPKLGATPSQIGRDPPPKLGPEVLYGSTKEAQGEAEPPGFAVWWSIYPGNHAEAQRAVSLHLWTERKLEQRASSVLFWLLWEATFHRPAEGMPMPTAWLKQSPWRNSRLPVGLDEAWRQRFGLTVHFSLSLSPEEQAPYLAAFADSPTPILQRSRAAQAWHEQRGRQ